MTRLSARCLVLLLVASLCFAVFTIGVSAADAGPSVTAVYGFSSGGTASMTGSLTSAGSLSYSSYQSATGRSLSIYLPSAGTLIFSISPFSGTYSYSGLTSSISDFTYSFTFVSTSSGNFNIPSIYSSNFSFKTAYLSVSSWTPDTSSGGSGGGESGGNTNDSSGNSILGPSQGGMDIWNSDGSINGDQRNDITGNSSKWNINSTYIGQLDYFIEGDEATYETSVWMSKMLANLAYTTWSWKYDESTGNFLYVRPNPGSWLDNIWQMNIYLYYNLANQKGWFGHINSEFATLNSRVLQILSVLANNEDVKIKDATTDHRNWIQDYFESEDSGKPKTSDNDAINDGMNTVKDQFQSDYGVSDIGSIFSGTSYDNNFWYSFWSQPVSDDVNGGGVSTFSVESVPDRWADRYSYDDDTIPDISGFGGDLGG